MASYIYQNRDSSIYGFSSSEDFTNYINMLRSSYHLFYLYIVGGEILVYKENLKYIKNALIISVDKFKTDKRVITCSTLFSKKIGNETLEHGFTNIEIGYNETTVFYKTDHNLRYKFNRHIKNGLLNKKIFISESLKDNIEKMTILRERTLLDKIYNYIPFVQKYPKYITTFY